MKNAHDSGISMLVRESDGASAASGFRFNEMERRAKVDELNARARAVRRLDYEKNRVFAEQALELASQTNALGQQYTFGMASALSLLAHRNCILGETDLALSQAHQALALLRPPIPSTPLGDLYDCIGWSHFCLGDFAEALDYLVKALDVAEQIGDRSLEAYVRDSIGNVHTSSGHPKIGLEMHERALAIHRELGDRMGEALALNNTAYTLMDLGRIDEALSAAETALAYAAEESRCYLQMWVLDTLADVHLRALDAELAEECARRALTLAREYDSEGDEANATLALGRTACLRERWDDALEAIERALELFERRGLTAQGYECHKLLSTIQENRGDLASALAHYKEYHELKQARVNVETQSRFENLRVAHQIESARKDAEIHRLRSLALEREIEERRVAQARLEAQASLDPLTGLFNRSHLEVLAEEVRLAGSSHVPVSLMMFDIDHFKRINDTYGHLVGDSVLVSVARQLSAHARESDVPCRYGGDEFLMLLVGMNADSAEKVAERLRQLIASSPIPVGDTEIEVAISVGVATSSPDQVSGLEELIESADRALYAAKQSGRNRVVVSRPTTHV